MSKLTKKRKKVPSILQMEAVECGAAALAMILQSYGLYIPLEELRIECGVSRDGSKASNILKAARNYGLIARGFKKEPGDLPNLPFPMIIHWNFNHFIVLEGIIGNKVYINDPAYGRRKITREEFDQAFTGVVLTFEKDQHFKKQGTKQGIAGTITGYLKNTKSGILFVLLAGLELVMLGMIVPLFSKLFVDRILIEQLNDWLLPLLLAMGVTAVLRGVFVWIKEHFLLRLETMIALSASSRFFWHILHLPITFFAQRYAGEVGNRITLSDNVARLLAGRLASSFLDFILIIFYLVLLFYYDWLLACAGIATAFCNMAFLKLASLKLKDCNLRLLQDKGKSIGFVMTGIQMIETIKSMGNESDFFTRWSGYQAKKLSSEQDVGESIIYLSVIPALIIAFNTAVVLLIGGFRIMHGVYTVGTLAAIQSLMAGFLAPVLSLVNLGAQIQQLKGDIVRLNDVYKHKRDPYLLPQPDTEDEINVYKLEGQLELKNITFGYNKLEAPLIENFNLAVAPGMRVALVGGSGSGKSTIAKLIAGLYEIGSGDILFDEKSRNDISREVLCQSLAMVDQDIAFFEGTIKENLTLWDYTIPDAAITEAARDACIHDDIASRPSGYDSLVEERGKNFSGGQRQRLEIARALVKAPRILILDEATSALDAKTEKNVDTNIRRRGCTTVIVAHRLSTIRDCDEIIVLEKGKVVERGTHNELLSAAGYYKRLIDMQTGETNE